jgi:hypothetical protein
MKTASIPQSRPRVDLFKMRVLDFIIIGMILLGSAAGLLKTIGARKDSVSPPTKVIVYQDGTAMQSVRLGGDREISLLDGKMVLEIHANQIRVKKSDCPRQYCVRQGWSRHAGESIVCVPFKILVEIQSDSRPVVDAVVF